MITAEAADNETVTVTVNYVYQANQAMVAQPYTAQIKKGAEFRKTLEVPGLFNYSIPSDTAVGLTDYIVLAKDDETGAYTLNFDLASVADNITVTLYYKAGTANYTVYHYYQDLENDTYTDQQPTVVELEGDIDAYTQAVANNKPGYHCKGVPQTTIAADGTTKVEIYYDRDYYTVTFDVNGGVNGPEPIYAKYGTTFEAESIKAPNRKGYTFLGWQPLLADTVTVEGNVTYVARWQPEKGQADYTIVLWGQNANDDEYSYLSSHDAWGNVGNQVTWNEDTLISHVHTDDCRTLICTQEEHSHTDEKCSLICLQQEHTHDSGCCSLEEHTHSVLCYPGASSTASSAGIGAPNNPSNGTIARRALTVNGKVIYFNGTWYEYNGDASNGDVVNMDCGKSEHAHSDGNCNTDKCGLEEHAHSDACYGCGKTEHSHTADCYSCSIPDTPVRHMSDIRPDEALWKLDHSDTVTVDANGSTVLNVYFVRTEFTLEFRAKNSNSNDFGTITARWGKDISAQYNAIADNAGSSFWSENRSASGPWTNYIGVMPQKNITYYRYETEGSGTSTMTYYGQDLSGDYQLIFEISFKGSNYTVTDEDRYEFEGYTCDLNASTKNGENCNGAKFYYSRKIYSLEFYSASNNQTDKSFDVKYQDSLSQYDYIPTDKPDGVESDAVFVGWYRNPECTGERFDLSAHVMPSTNMALYAKWVNGLYTVKTYTDETMQTLYIYEGYNGEQTDIEKYTLASEPAPPVKDGYVFAGWFYKDGETEKPFSFTMPITKNYNLYPKFSEPVAVSYTVHYYKEGTTEMIADDRINSVMFGTTVTEKAKMGTELNLLPEDKQNKYYPTNTSTSVIINELDKEIIFYYTEAASVEYTVYYRDAFGNDLIEPVTKSTEYSTVTEQYVPIDNYAPRQFSITQDLSSDSAQNAIIFLYDPTLASLTVQKSGWNAADENQTFLFRIKGTGENTKDIDLTVTVHGNGKTTVTQLPVGSYTVTEKTDWSWRYSPGESTQSIFLTSDGLVLTFENIRTEEKWLDGDSYQVNHFGQNQ
ncbi:MAG: InlB B-repeat-containing protein [Firmicutes bacterium]|nr:InlB B-repeat-containing protein [Bacillota bacterium]